MDILFLRDFRLEIIIGLYEWERKAPQPVLIDLEIGLYDHKAGHSDDIHDTIRKADAVTERPAMIIAHTIKGKGNRETEGLVDCHNVKIPDETTYQRIMCGLECKCDLPY